jgi:hypothetical protein
MTHDHFQLHNVPFINYLPTSDEQKFNLFFLENLRVEATIKRHEISKIILHLHSRDVLLEIALNLHLMPFLEGIERCKLNAFKCIKARGRDFMMSFIRE